MGTSRLWVSMVTGKQMLETTLTQNGWVTIQQTPQHNGQHMPCISCRYIISGTTSIALQHHEPRNVVLNNVICLNAANLNRVPNPNNVAAGAAAAVAAYHVSAAAAAADADAGAAAVAAAAAAAAAATAVAADVSAAAGFAASAAAVAAAAVAAAAAVGAAVAAVVATAAIPEVIL